jgi:F-type H+-transporting ATPase subunit delta
VTAEVTSAKALTKAQSDKLAKTLKAKLGKTVTINATVDESLIGGLVVKVGSKMIDTSIRSKLNSLQNVMKEVG